MTSNATSPAVRDQLIQALELDLVGPSPTLLAQLEAEGRTEEATELREELLDRPPNRWYQSGFLIPSETSLGDRADDAADDEFAGLDGQNLSAKRKSNASGDDTGASEAWPARRVFFTCSVLISNKAPHSSKSSECPAGVASLPLVHGNDSGADLPVDRCQGGFAELCC